MKTHSASGKKRVKSRLIKFLRNLDSRLPVLRALLIFTIMLLVWGAPHITTGIRNHYFRSTAIDPKLEVFAPLTVPGPKQSASQFSSYPTWSQNFAEYDSSSVNSKYWETYVGSPPNSNNEAEYYTNNKNNLNVNNGSLNLTATQQSEPLGFKYGASRIDTENKISFLYGRFDVMAKMPSGVGTWPAVWFLPANNIYERLSPSSDSFRYTNGGEMDLIEAVGFNPNIEYGVVHTRSDLSNPNGEGAFNQVFIPRSDQNYNLYSLLWTPNTITYEVNNVVFFTYHKTNNSNYYTWPFDQPFYLIINLALGGTWGGEDTSQFPGNGVDNSALPATFQIKSINYYSYLAS